MEKFMLIIREDLGKMGKMTDEERFANMGVMEDTGDNPGLADSQIS
jgi:hypothetical protein